ncbi:uncharacterized protein LOC112042615 [Lingula anatina]|uniref:Uncharacterized protein LOC112042615 n=1 Tax=Lingula anatina TaxID=7574 RepID=A0A2R2MSV2_LINAN|nr:uncharacterized protein LOC112042615 [Lingula anatina]|eukprot:XP_023933203.1 uncharacterized protein LOC112042615 [Lingula anatina]
MNSLWHFKPGVMYRLLKSPEYVEFRKVIVLQEARFMEITEEGEGIRSVHLALTADTLFIAEKCLPDYVKQPEVWTESDPELEGVELISILPLDASDIVVQDDRKYKRIHVDLPNGTARHYEYAETVRSERIWKSWVQDVAVLNRQQTEDAESHVNLTVIRVTTCGHFSKSS